MKRAGKLVVGAIASIALLAGGTFAAFVVVDNANAIGIQVTPGSLTEAETNEKITLAWGENTIANVEELGLGATKKVGNLVLKASYSAANLPNDTPYESYTGLLDIAVQDITVRQNENVPKFIDYLSVHVVEGDIAIGNYDVNNAMTGTPDNNGITRYTAVGNTAGRTYSVFVTLDDAASPVYNTIKNDKVYLSFDWNKANEDTLNDDSTTTYYFYDEHDVFGDAYAYAWGGDKHNGEWPGQHMTEIVDGYYSLDVSNELDKIIFSNNNDKQTVDLELDPAKQYWTLGALSEGKYLATASAEAPNVLTANYYVVGTMNNWGYSADYAMVADGDNNLAKFVYDGPNFNTNTGEQENPVHRLKVLGKDGTWYGGEGGNDVLFEADKVCTGYTVYLNNAGVVYLDAQYQA